MGIFTTFETFLTGELHHLLATYLAIFSGKIILLIRLGAPILVLYYGYSIMMPGGSNATLKEMMSNFARIALVFVFVDNSNGLLNLLIGFINELKTGFVGEQSLFALLDEQFVTAQKLSQTVKKLDTAMVPLEGVLSSWMVRLGSIFVTASSAIIFIAAEAALTLLTVTSPIFIGCLTYGFTRELFNGWLRSVFSCIITLIFATLVVKIGIDISNGIIRDLAINPEQDGLMTIGATALLTGIIISSLVFVAAKMAGNIAGVAASSAIQGGMTLATRAGMVGTATAAAGVAKYAGGKIRDKIQSRKLKQKSQASSFARLQQINSNNS